MADCPVIAVVGGGASGTLTAVHLLRRLRGTTRAAQILLIDRDSRHGTGVAYSTVDGAHLLNSPLGRMSAVAGDPEHLRRWMTRLRGTSPDPGEFLPRALFGRYLRETLAEAEWTTPHCRVRRVTAEVRGLRPTGHGYTLEFAHGRSVSADLVVLATGNPPNRPLAVHGRPHRHIRDPWAPGALERLLALPTGDGPVLVVGTGLTMVDLVLSLTGRAGGPPVLALSRHGLLPRAHPDPLPRPRPTPLPPGPPTLAGLLRAVRTQIEADPPGWAGVVDGLRPLVPDLWAGLTEPERRRFLALLARTWEIHRHRMAPPVAAAIAAAQRNGRLTVQRGELVGAEARTDGVDVVIRRQGRLIRRSVPVLVNATGPDGDLVSTSDPLLRRSHAAGVLRPDRLRLGLDTDAHGRVRDAAGRPAERLFTLGPPLRGLHYESTAVPEIRDQAARLATTVTAALDTLIFPVHDSRSKGNRRRFTSVVS